MIQTYSNARASNNNCLVVDGDRLHLSKVPVRDLPESVELSDEVPGVVLDNATAHVPLAGVITVKLGLKSNCLTIEYLAAPNYLKDSSELTLASKEDATSAFTTIQSRLGDDFKLRVENEDAAQPARWLLGSTLATVILYSIALGLEHAPENLIIPIQALFGFAAGTSLMVLFTLGRTPEFRGLLTAIAVVIFSIAAAMLAGSVITLMLGMTAVAACFCWLIMQLLQMEQSVVLRRRIADIQPEPTLPPTNDATELMPPPEGLTEVDGVSPDISSESPPPPQS